MKHYIFIILGILICYGCTNESNDDSTSPATSYLRTERRITEDTWTTHEFCSLNGTNDSVKSPWAGNNVITTIPSGIRKDVKEEDGWSILYSSMKINGYKRDYNYQPTDKYANYIILYNHFNGMLKGFCYITEPVQQNNMAMWHISTNDSTRLFNFAGEEAIPYNGPKSKDVYISNITNEGIAKGFNKGWNCFQIELAYDADSPMQTLNIDAITLNETSYNFDGTMGFTSDGVIVTSIQKPQNNIFKGTATAIGDAAKKYIEKNFENKAKTTRGIVASTIGSLVSYGANKIFSSIFGKSTSTTSEQTISIKSKGEVMISGKSIQPATGIITPISDISLNKLGYALGIWNLLDVPSYQIERIANLKNYFYIGNIPNFRYNIISSANYTIIKNPSTYTQTEASIIYQNGINSTINSVIDTQPTMIFKGTQEIPRTYILPNIFNIILSSNKYIPQKKVDTNTPGINLKDINCNIYNQNTRLCLVKRIYTTAQYISTKTFKTKNIFCNKIDARPNQWTIKDLKSEGYETSN